MKINCKALITGRLKCVTTINKTPHAYTREGVQPTNGVKKARSWEMLNPEPPMKNSAGKPSYVYSITIEHSNTTNRDSKNPKQQDIQ
jgi:hypothetical protein